MVTVSKSEVFKMLENAGVISAEERAAIEKILDKEPVASSFKNVTEQKDEVIVSEVFRKIGIPCNILGYKYLKFAILSVLEKPELMKSVTKELYPVIATNFNSTTSRVERSIRHAIKVAWDRGNSEVQTEVFGSTINFKKGNPTNSEFIAGLVEYIKVN